MSKEVKTAKRFIEEENFNESMRRELDDTERRDSDALIKYVLNSKAWNDTVIYERMKNGSPIMKNKDNVCKAFMDEITKLNESSNYQSWHKGALNRLLGKECFESRFGMAQKFLNMSVKYFYFLEIAYGVRIVDNLSLEKYKYDFDVPIDSFILKWLIYNSVGNEEFASRADEITSWNKMERDIYPFLQDKVKALLKERYIEVDSPLIAETLAWSGIKDLKKRINMEI